MLFRRTLIKVSSQFISIVAGRRRHHRRGGFAKSRPLSAHRRRPHDVFTEPISSRPGPHIDSRKYLLKYNNNNNTTFCEIRRTV